jgi:HNH endonuclease
VRRPAMGQRARRRVRAGGPRATGRPAASVAEWGAIRALVLARAGWRCQACGFRQRLDVHHVVKRAQGGSDFDLDHLVTLCRACHAQTDAAYATGRLVVTSLGAGEFRLAVIRRPSKWATPEPAPTGDDCGAHRCRAGADVAHVGKVSQAVSAPVTSGRGTFGPRGQRRAGGTFLAVQGQSLTFTDTRTK